MSCDACKSKIETLLGPLQGVQVLKIDVPSQRVLLELSNTSQTVNELQSLIEQKTGIKTVVKGFGSELAAVAEIQGQSNIIGVVRMAQLTGNTCLVDGVIDGLFKSNGHSYSLNIHKFGDLSKPTLENVGPVFIPISKQLKETSENRASFKVELPNCDLSGCIGRAMAIGDNHSKQLLAGRNSRQSFSSWF
ncbi:Copper chaperone for superoxide dismutase [Halotydeus destructor]|nr:Copper chaperone for superoxide dismutase [Halotydeus destructor]